MYTSVRVCGVGVCVCGVWSVEWVLMVFSGELVNFECIF